MNIALLSLRQARTELIVGPAAVSCGNHFLEIFISIIGYKVTAEI